MYLAFYHLHFTVRNVVAARYSFHKHLWFCSKGGCLADTPLGRHPQAEKPLPRQKNPSPGRHLARHPLGRHPPGQTPRGRYPLGRHPLGRHPPGRHPPATAADGTHPTGMHLPSLYPGLWCFALYKNERGVWHFETLCTLCFTLYKCSYKADNLNPRLVLFGTTAKW